MLESWTFNDKCPKCANKWFHKSLVPQSFIIIPVAAFLTLCFKVLINFKPNTRKYKDLSRTKKIFRTIIQYLSTSVLPIFYVIAPKKVDIVPLVYLKYNISFLFCYLMAQNIPQFLFRVLDSDIVEDYIDIDELSNVDYKGKEKNEERSTKKIDEQLYGNPSHEDPILKDDFDKNIVDRKHQEKLKKNPK